MPEPAGNHRKHEEEPERERQRLDVICLHAVGASSASYSAYASSQIADAVVRLGIGDCANRKVHPNTAVTIKEDVAGAIEQFVKELNKPGDEAKENVSTVWVHPHRGPFSGEPGQ
jgi:hypothetical protein